MAIASVRSLGWFIGKGIRSAAKAIAVTAALGNVALCDLVQATDQASQIAPAPIRDSEVVPAAANASAVNQPSVYRPMNDFSIRLNVPRLNPGWDFHAGLLYLQPSAENLGYAVLTNEENLSSPVPIAQPFWGVKSLNPGLQPGFEIGARYAFANTGRDFQFNWQHLRTSTSDWVSPTQAQGQWVSPFSQTGPAAAESYSDLMANQGVNKLRAAWGNVQFAYDQVNLDFGQHVNFGSALGLRLFGGISYAQLQEKVVSSFFGVPPGPLATFPQSVPLMISLDNTSRFWGVGPRLGIDSSYRIPYGFSVNGQLGTALLIGRTQPAQYLFNATSPELAAAGIAANPEHISSSTFTQVVYSANAKIGLGYTRAVSNRHTFSLELGYLASIFVNPFSGYETNNNVLALQIGSLSTASVRHTLSNFTLNGIYGNAGFKW
jgi:hypothetical protein